MSVAGLVRRPGTNLNQTPAKLNSTGQAGANLIPRRNLRGRDLAAG
jgi:hypothetical protein